jgi:hypothetical protein
MSYVTVPRLNRNSDREVAQERMTIYTVNDKTHGLDRTGGVRAKQCYNSGEADCYGPRSDSFSIDCGRSQDACSSLT